MSDVYSLSNTVEINFILPKLDLKKLTKKGIKFFKLRLFIYVKNLETFYHFFFTSSPKILYKSVPLSITKVSCKIGLLLVANYYDLSYPKVLYKSVILSAKNVALRNLTSLIIPKGVF